MSIVRLAPAAGGGTLPAHGRPARRRPTAVPGRLDLVPAAVPAGCRYGIRRPEALLAATCRQSGSLPARVRSASRRCRGRRGDCAGPLRSGFAGCGAPEAADGSVRKDALPAPFLSGLLPPRCASLLVREPQRIGEAAQGAR